MMRAAPQLNAELQSLSQIHEMVARAEAVLKGDFKRELEQMRLLREDIAVRQGTIDTVEKAAAVKREADEYAAQVRAEADAYKASAAGTLSNAAAKLSTVEAREQAVERREAEAMRRDAELDQRRDALLRDETIKRAAFDKREATVAAREADINKRAAALTAKEQKAREYLESMR